jgi:antitoxin HicB
MIGIALILGFATRTTWRRKYRAVNVIGLREASLPFGTLPFLEEIIEHAVKAVISRQLQKTMEERGLSKKTIAALMGTSRSQPDRLLDPESDAVTLKSLVRGARLVGKRIKINLVDAA